MISCEFLPETFGGAEQQCMRQSAELVRRGHRVVIMTSRKQWSVPAHDTIDGVEVRRFMTFRAPDLLGRHLAFSLIWIAQVVRFCIRYRRDFDVVHCHQGKFGIFIGALAARIMGVPQIVKMGNSGNFFDLKSLQRKKIVGPYFLRYALRRKPVCVAISSMIVRDLVRFGVPESHIELIVNGVIPVRSEFKRPNPAALEFFWHGRFEAIKNLTLMLDGFATACASNTNLYLTLIGHGSLQDTLIAQAERRGIADRVRVLPPSKDILKEISRYDVFINTSHAEGLSNSMLEAMACGKIMISTPVSGATEVIDEGKNGYIIPDYTDQAIADTILQVARLSSEEMEAMYHYNKKKTLEKFDIVKVMDQYEALYHRLIHNCEAQPATSPTQ